MTWVKTSCRTGKPDPYEAAIANRVLFRERLSYLRKDMISEREIGSRKDHEATTDRARPSCSGRDGRGGLGAAMQIWTLEHFAGCLGQGFDLDLGTGSMALTLAEAQPMQAYVAPGRMRTPFSLLFRSASAVLLPQKVYRVTHAALGALDIFLVPVGRDREGIIYQAVFN